MNLKCIRLYKINLEGQVQVLTKFNANDECGIFKDFFVVEGPNPNEYLLLVACADGNLYYQSFNTNSKGDLILVTRMNIPSGLVPRGSVCMGVSYSPQSNIVTLSHKNGVNIFGSADFKNFSLTNCCVYRPLLSQNKHGLLSLIERSGEIMVNTSEIYVDESNSLMISTLRDPHNQNNYSVHSGYITAISISDSTVTTQPLGSNFLNLSEESKCEGYCVLKHPGIHGISIVLSIHENGLLNLFAFAHDGTSVHELQKNLSIQINKAQTSEQIEPRNPQGEKSKSKSDKSEKSNENNRMEEENSSNSNQQSFKLVKNELKQADLLKDANLVVDFMNRYQSLRKEATVEVNKTRYDQLLQNDRSSMMRVIVAKQGSSEVVVKLTNKANIITGIRIVMQVPSNTGVGVYSVRIFNRELKIANNSNNDKKIVDISLSNLEAIYAHLQGSISFVLDSSSSISNQMKYGNPFEVRLIFVDPFGCSIAKYNLKDKLDLLKEGLKLQSLSAASPLSAAPTSKANPVQTSAESSLDTILEQLASTKKIYAVDFLKRRAQIKSQVHQNEERQLIDNLDLLCYQLHSQINTSQISNDKRSQSLVSSDKLIKLANSLKVILNQQQQQQHAKTNQSNNSENNNNNNANEDQNLSEILIGSAKRCLKCVLKAYALVQNQKVFLSHPMEYITFKLLARTGYYFDTTISSESTKIDQIYQFLKKLEKLAVDKAPLVFIVFAKYPEILSLTIKKIFNVAKGEIDEQIVIKTISVLFKLIPIYYQFRRNVIESTNQNKPIIVESCENEKLEAAEEAFELVDSIILGLSKSNLKKKMVEMIKYFCLVLRSETVVFTDEQKANNNTTNNELKSKSFEFAFDLLKPRKARKSSSQHEDFREEQMLVKENSRKQSMQVDNMQDSNINHLLDNGDEQAVNDLLMAGFDEMNEEEMMKLAIEMSLQDKGNQPEVPQQESPKLMEVEEEDIPELVTNKNQEECKRNEDSDDDIEIVDPKGEDMIDENEALIGEQVRIQQITLSTFDINSEFARVIIRRITRALKTTLLTEKLFAYLYWIQSILKNSQTSLFDIAYELASAYYSIISFVSTTTLTTNSSASFEDSKICILCFKIIFEVIRDISLEHKEPQSKEVKLQQEIQLQRFKNLKAEFKIAFRKYEESKNVSFNDKLYEVTQTIIKHFETSKSSLKIEYANGEIVSVTQKVENPKSISELIQQCFGSIEQFNEIMPQIVSIGDQIQFNSIMGILHDFISLDSKFIDSKTHGKWTNLLGSILVTPTTSWISERRVEKILKILMTSKASYYEIRDRIALSKEYLVIARIYSDSAKFTNIVYDQLLVLVQSIGKVLTVASERRQGLLKLILEKPNLVQILYEAIFNNIKGCVEPCLKLISIYYGKPNQ